MPSEYISAPTPLDDDVDEVVLEVLGDARDERDAHRHAAGACPRR